MRSRATPWSVLLLAGCLSQNPPSPAVRWFDPLPTAAPAAPSWPGLRVAPAPFVRQDFVVRIAERELAIDGLHRWIAPPEQLVTHVLGGGGRGDGPELELLRFELDLTASPRAVIVLAVADRTIAVEAPATGTGPDAFAAAMAAALGRTPAAVAAVLPPTVLPSTVSPPTVR